MLHFLTPYLQKAPLLLILLLVSAVLWGQRQNGVNKLWETKTAHPSEVLDFTHGKPG